MKLVAKIAIAAVAAASIAGPAMAGEWVYHGGPKSPDSTSWYEPDSYVGDTGVYTRYDGPRAYDYDRGPSYAVPDDGY